MHVNLQDVSSVIRILTGEHDLFPSVAPMEMPPELPVDPMKVMCACIYQQPDCQPVFEQALCIMGNGSADQVYLFFEFVDTCLFCELHQKTAAFQINRQLLLPHLKQQIRRCEEELRGTVRFSNGHARTNLMKHIEETVQWYQKHCGLDLFA
jgi:hypothetical protein